MSVIELTEDNFDEEVIYSDIPVLVDFYATWCSPCKMLAPEIERLSELYGDSIKVCKLNVDSARSIIRRYAVESVPTVMLFLDGKITNRFTGYRPAQAEAMLRFAGVQTGKSG